MSNKMPLRIVFVALICAAPMANAENIFVQAFNAFTSFLSSSEPGNTQSSSGDSGETERARQERERLERERFSCSLMTV